MIDPGELILGAVLGGSGAVGFGFYFFRRYIENRLKTAEDQAKSRRAVRMKRVQIEDELRHCYGRMFFWLYRWAITGSRNGELDSAFQDLETAEERKKQLDREIIAASEGDGK